MVDRSRSATPPYDGQLGAGAAVGALECEGKTPYDDGLGVYDDGLAKVQGSAEAALDDYMSESGLSFSTPSEGYAVERDQDGRVLFSTTWTAGRRSRASLPTRFAAGTVTRAGASARVRSAIHPSCLRTRRTTSTSACGRTIRLTRAHHPHPVLQGRRALLLGAHPFLLLGPERKADWYVKDIRAISVSCSTRLLQRRQAPRGRHRHRLPPRRPPALSGPAEPRAELVSLDDADDVHRGRSPSGASGARKRWARTAALR